MDWVYRPTAVGEGAGDWGTYRGAFSVAINSGVAGATILILYDSIDFLMQVDRVSNILPRAARAEGRQPMIGGVEVDYAYTPDTWASGGVLQWGWRVGFFEQDPTDGSPTVLTEYTMWAPTPDVQQPAIDANDAMTNIRDWREYKAFNSQVTDPWYHTHKLLKFRRRMPGSRYCLGLYIEGSPASSNVRMQVNCRTLVADEG